ncbi:hypothetical protein CEE34_06395 [Candidatus Aerophobetes bacterium Ae_b3a]|nr:MAG: hypothetical protein CEE34_06395 [Candidatus Aerophobetes bacterium Ae_b3a]
MNAVNDREIGRLCRTSKTRGEKESQSLRQEFVYRIWYIVYREKKKQKEKNVGLEAESSASGGWKMSAANDSETGWLRGATVR